MPSAALAVFDTYVDGLGITQVDKDGIKAQAETLYVAAVSVESMDHIDLHLDGLATDNPGDQRIQDDVAFMKSVTAQIRIDGASHPSSLVDGILVR